MILNMNVVMISQIIFNPLYISGIMEFTRTFEKQPFTEKEMQVFQHMFVSSIAYNVTKVKSIFNP